MEMDKNAQPLSEEQLKDVAAGSASTRLSSGGPGTVNTLIFGCSTKGSDLCRDCPHYSSESGCNARK